MSQNTFYVIDFDSTFTKVEAFDLLGEISLKNHPQKKELVAQIKDITNKGMDGTLSFRESLEQRLSLLQASKAHIEQLIDHLQDYVSTSFLRNREFLRKHASEIYIISNGFSDFIVPIVEALGISAERVYANTFIYDSDGKITGFDKENVLSSNTGKVALLKTLNLPGKVYVIGDGYTDYEIKAAGLADKFFAFTENVSREQVTKNADHVTPTLDEFLYVNKMIRAYSYPKNRIKVLLLENIHSEAAKILSIEGYSVEVHSGAMDEDELSEKIKNVSILGIRSKTQVSQKVLENANRLMAIGAFCIGTNQIDLSECLRKGISVFNAPYSNTRSVVEMAIAEIIMLLRNLPDKSANMHRGVWDKSASNSFEVRSKTLGIVGYGNIGAQLSVLAEDLGMRVLYYDIEEKLPLGNVKKAESLEQLLEESDIVSLHVDGRASNFNLISDREFERMRDGVIFLNLSRGHVVNISALRIAILSGKVKGAAVDVFPYEPKTNNEEFLSELRGLPNTILSPHIGGSTEEAQLNIARFVPGRIIEYINTGSTTNGVNFPNLALPKLENAHRLIHIHHNSPGILAKINQVLASHGINIVGQYLKTNELIGYVITDIDKAYNEEVIKSLKGIEGTIRFRVLY
jgi:D-3-phosphoglycerate dehydrogenase / 2-oxoglutarate reductase